jgi:anthranilate phosphoribosyltransferase
VSGPSGDRSWSSLITQLVGGRDLSADDTAWAMHEVMSGDAAPVPLAGFLVALRAKGETVEEISGLVATMLRHAVRIEVPGSCLDVVGTGGDRLNTVNISTMAALVAAGAGARVVKHGNRAASSSTGSADVLEALGVRLDLEPERVAQVAVEAGITFCFAQRFHPSLRHAAAARSGLGVATAFNFLGPLTNPAQPAASAIGVSDPRMAPILAGVLAARRRSGLVFRGHEGLDELSVCGPSTVWTVADGTVSTQTLDPRDLGLAISRIEDLRGGQSQHNAEVVEQVLSGAPGPVRDAVLLTTGAALAASDLAGLGWSGGLQEALAQGMARAAESVDSGAAAGVLQAWVAASRR